jgi:hypothetical protein
LGDSLRETSVGNSLRGTRVGNSLQGTRLGELPSGNSLQGTLLGTLLWELALGTINTTFKLSALLKALKQMVQMCFFCSIGTVSACLRFRHLIDEESLSPSGRDVGLMW